MNDAAGDDGLTQGADRLTQRAHRPRHGDDGSGRPRSQSQRPAPGSARAIAVIDLDGVVADVSHRLRHLKKIPKDWEAFFAAAGADPVLPEGRAVAEHLNRDHEIVYLSGRPERLRRVTVDWLAEHRFPEGRILLRADDDRRPARVMKIGALRRLATEARIAVLVDDDLEVCRSARQAGFTVLVADWATARAPAADDVLARAQEVDGRT